MALGYALSVESQEFCICFMVRLAGISFLGILVKRTCVSHAIRTLQKLFGFTHFLSILSIIEAVDLENISNDKLNSKQNSSINK